MKPIPKFILLLASFLSSLAHAQETRSRRLNAALGINAFRRSTGEYLVFVEENYKTKSLIYRWKP